MSDTKSTHIVWHAHTVTRAERASIGCTAPPRASFSMSAQAFAAQTLHLNAMGGAAPTEGSAWYQ